MSSARSDTKKTPAISIQGATTPSPSTPSSLLSKSMSSSMKHEVFDLNARWGSSVPCPLIVSTSGQGFSWNRDVFLRDEFFGRGHEERQVIHEIHLDDDEMMF